MITVIIQARMGSSRLPGKVLLPFGERTLLGYLIQRLKLCSCLDQIVLATSLLAEDTIVENEAHKYGIKVFRGSGRNVLSRFYNAAIQNDASIIVRVTCDDPFKDSKIIEKATHKLITENLDYCSNTLTPTYPEGLDVEVFKFSALELAYNSSQTCIDVEHVTPYIWRNHKLFSIGQIKTSLNRASWRMTIDYKDDYTALSKLQKIVSVNASYKTLVDAVEKAQIKHIMFPKIKRNEGLWQN